MPEISDSDLFALVTRMVTSAPLSLVETPSLGALRLLDAASRLMQLTDDEFLAEAHGDYLANLRTVMTDQTAFQEWMSGYVHRFSEEALRRTMAS